MNRSSFAFLVAVLIHLLFILIFWILGTLAPEIKKPLKKEEKKIKISLKEMPKTKKPSGDTKKELKPSPIAPPMPKGSQLKKIVEQAPVKYEPKKEQKKPKLNKPIEPPKTKPESQSKTKPLPPEKPYIPLFEPKKQEPKKEYKEEVKKETKKDPLSWMYQDLSEKEEKVQNSNKLAGSSINQNIQELYGDEFGKLTPGQQKYILDNQEIMRRITQQVLTRVARVNLKTDLNVNRSNVIEFYLHPNGDMSDFRFLEKSGYYILDDTTKETIEYAYSRYPRPTEKTLVRYNVYYHLARY